VRYLYSLSEQPLTKFDTWSEVIRSHCLHLLEVVGVKMLIVQNLPYQRVVYSQGVCSASGTGISVLFKMVDYFFFKVWCMALPRTSTEVFVRTRVACWTQTPLQSRKHNVSWVTFVSETLLIELARLSFIPSGFPIDERHLDVVCICVHVCHSLFQIYNCHTNEEETTRT
jgi:hypothetical protein